MKYTNVLNPQWANVDRNSINLELVTEGFGNFPFTASPDDSTEYGPEIFGRVLAGEFGDIADPAPPADISPEAKIRRESLWIDSQLVLAGNEMAKHEDADPGAVATLEKWRAYRRELRAWPSQAGFPDATLRPSAPAPD